MIKIKKLLDKIFCCRKNAQINLIENKANTVSAKPKYLLLVEKHPPYRYNNAYYYLTKNNIVLPQVQAVTTYNPNSYTSDIVVNNWPHEYILQNILPPKTDNKPTLVLDLDHTLIFPSQTKLEKFDFNINILHNNKIYDMYFIKRPYLEEFLEELSAHYEMIVYTAGIMQYGLKILKHIDPKSRRQYCLSRNYCSILTKNGHTKDLYVKNLSILGRDLTKTILIDDKTFSYAIHEKNGQYIPGFYGESHDNALKILKEYLIKIKDISDFTNRDNCEYF